MTKTGAFSYGLAGLQFIEKAEMILLFGTLCTCV